MDRPVHGATPDLHDGYQEFIIEAGAHYASTNPYKAISNKKEIHFKVWFDSTCIYTNTNPVNQSDINKLYGFGDCGTDHQQSSARFGWSWNGNVFDIFAYCYNNSVRQWKLLGSVHPLEKADLSISVSPKKYLFRFNEKLESMERTCSTEQIEGYQLYPYFGGNEPAPHKMIIYIKEL